MKLVDVIKCYMFIKQHKFNPIWIVFAYILHEDHLQQQLDNIPFFHIDVSYIQDNQK